ncbi:MAG TPA: glycosyltransferase family 39 protein, partial [Ktedonobacterales bacterium]|nr:glycosyltransferase family 39 protein [Ktedonobacterales bacterium]
MQADRVNARSALLSASPSPFVRMGRGLGGGATAVAVVVLALIGLYLATYQLNYEVFWQDEATSVYAAQQVLHTGIPRLLSGFIYTKSELYSYMLAVVELFFGTNPIALRLLSVAEYLASLLLTFHMGRRFFDKRVGLLAMALLVFSPMALRWGREARMYQQAELCLLIVVFLFYQALQAQERARPIYLSMAAVVVMYFSHEETFIVLPALLIYFLATQRLRWVRNPHWWIAGMAAIAIILFQLLLAQTTHPPILGTDRSQIPMIAFAPQNFDFYMRLLFASRAMGHGTYPSLGVTSALIVASALVALFATHRPLRYLCTIFFVSLGCLIFVFTLTADRYIYPLLPIMAMLAAAMVVWGCDRLARWLHRQLAPVAARIIMAALALLFVGT